MRQPKRAEAHRRHRIRTSHSLAPRTPNRRVASMNPRKIRRHRGIPRAASANGYFQEWGDRVPATHLPRAPGSRPCTPHDPRECTRSGSWETRELAWLRHSGPWPPAGIRLDGATHRRPRALRGAVLDRDRPRSRRTQPSRNPVPSRNDAIGSRGTVIVSTPSHPGSHLSELGSERTHVLRRAGARVPSGTP